MFKFSFLKNIIKLKSPYKVSKKLQIINDLENTLEELNMLKHNYQLISGEAIDSYVFQINAVELRYRSLLNKLKKYD